MAADEAEALREIVGQLRTHLADLGIIRTRRRLLDAAKALAANGTVPPGVNDPGSYRVRTGELFLPEGADWVEETRELRKSPLPGQAVMTPV